MAAGFRGQGGGAIYVSTVAGQRFAEAGDGAQAGLAAREVLVQADAARILDGVSVSVGAGEFLGLIGPNGAGKSTLLRAMSGVLRRRAGTVTLEGRDLDAMGPGEVARVLALAPQLAPYTYGFTALEVVMMGRYPHMGRFQVEGAAERRIAEEALERTEAARFAHREVATLSGGERQRVFLARALAQAPRVLLLDEPTSNLDIQHQMRALALVRELAREGIAAIAAIHDLTLAARYCDRLVLLHEGRVAAEGAPREVLTPERIERVFGVRAVVYPDPLTGSLTLSLLDASPGEAAVGSQRRVHVVCGGGRGARLLYELKRAGYVVTAGVLGAGDTDRSAADILGVEYVAGEVFGEIDQAAHARHMALARQADAAVLCETPFGHNNILNLVALSAARRLVSVESGPFSRRDFSRGEAQSLFDALRPAARCKTLEETLAAVHALAEAARGGAE